MNKKTSLQLLRPTLVATALLAPLAQADVIDFEGLPAGQIVSSLNSSGGAGPIGVNGFNPDLGNQNAAVIFDSANPTGNDNDLGTPNVDFGGPGVGAGGSDGAAGENSVARGNLLIVDEHLVTGGGGLVTNPDDAAVDGATLEFDFSALGSVTVSSVSYVDVEISRTGSVALFGADDAPLGVFPIAAVGDNGVGVIDTKGAGGVLRMVVTFGGSGALSAVEFDVDLPFVFCESNDNSTGLPGGIDWGGTTSIVGNDFELVLSNLPANKPAYLIYGSTQASIPFGDGIRCIGGQLFRYTKIPSTGPNGVVTVPFDFNQPPLSGGPGQILPGRAYYFQAWFRDMAGPSGFNTTAGLCVTFAP